MRTYLLLGRYLLGRFLHPLSQTFTGCVELIPSSLRLIFYLNIDCLALTTIESIYVLSIDHHRYKEFITKFVYYNIIFLYIYRNFTRRFHQHCTHFHLSTGCPPAPEYGVTYFPLSTNLQCWFPLLFRISRCPESRKSQLLGSQKSITVHFWDPPSAFVISMHLSQQLCFMPQTPLRATKQLGRSLALWFHFSQAQTLSEKQVAKPLVICGELLGLQAMASSPIWVLGTATSCQISKEEARIVRLSNAKNIFMYDYQSRAISKTYLTTSIYNYLPHQKKINQLRLERVRQVDLIFGGALQLYYRLKLFFQNEEVLQQSPGPTVPFGIAQDLFVVDLKAADGCTSGTLEFFSAQQRASLSSLL